MVLFRGPGYELALAFGIVGPFLASLWVSLGQSKRSFLGSLARGGALFGIIWILAVLGSWMSPACERSEGYALLALGSGLGVVLAALVTESVMTLRSAIPALERVPRWAVGVLVPLGPIAVGLHGLYASPSVFAYSEFLGYFAGPLYDRVEYRFDTLLTYRAISLMLAASCALLIRKEAKARWAGGACLALYSGLRLSGDLFGHETSAASLSRALNGSAAWGPCTVRYAPDKTRRTEAELVARECSVHLREVSEYFGVEAPGRVTVHLFASVAEKAIWTGAGRTYVAKPWRDEVYVHASGYPHPVLRHELAHVVAARFGRGPFKIAGALAGLIPDPGRIEGFAVAAAPSESSDGTLAEWARAQLDQGAMPPLGRLFQFGFYGESSARAYGAAGAFVAFLHEQYGASTLRAWYAGAKLESLTKKSLSELEESFHDALKQENVPAVVRNAARERYSTPAVLERVCPHAVDRALAEAQEICSLDPRLAEREVERAAAWDPGAKGEALWLSDCFLRTGDSAHASAILSPKSEDAPWVREEKTEKNADLDWLGGERERALAAYLALVERATSSAGLRALDLKIWALTTAQGSREEELIRDALAARAEPLQVVSLIAERREDGPPRFLEEYLLGRALKALGQGTEAGRAFQRARTLQAPSFELLQENERSLILSLCEARRAAEAHEVFRSVDLARRSLMRQLELQGIMRRCVA